MSINVTCPGCHARFQVSDKFGGKTGPCPKCKTPMNIPKKEDQVVIHAPDSDVPKDSTGKSVLAPIKRKETKISPVAIAGIVGTSVMVPVIAWIMSRTFPVVDDKVQAPMWFLSLGALLLAPPLVLAGYTFLRNDELEPYRGRPLMIRVAICATIYAGLWGLHLYMGKMLYGPEISLPEVLIALPILFIPGALASLATLDLDGTSASMHYGLYLLVTVGLRLLIGLSPL